MRYYLIVVGDVSIVFNFVIREAVVIICCENMCWCIEYLGM